MCKILTSKGSTVFFSLVLLLFGMNFSMYAQTGPSFSAGYEYFPYKNLANPAAETSQDEMKIGIKSLNLGFSYPLIYSKGRTVIMNEVLFRRFDMDYKGWENIMDEESKIEHAYSIEYSFVLKHIFSQKWTLMTILTPGIATDFEADISGDAFTYQAVVVFIRRYNEKLSVGYGAAYTNQFGTPAPIPVLALNWNNGARLRANVILPVSIELWYTYNKNLEIGLLTQGNGNQYHGNPARWDVNVPYLRYSAFGAGPAVNYSLAENMKLNIHCGYTFLRRFEFFDNKIEKGSYDLKQTLFIKAGINIGL